MIELQFPVLGTQIPADHGYALYSALSRILPKLHSDEFPVRIGPIRGSYAGNGTLRLDPRFSRLRVRLQPEDLPALLPLAGKDLNLDGHVLHVAVPQVRSLTPVANLVARTVTIKASSPKLDPSVMPGRDPSVTKRYLVPGEFLGAIRHELQRRGIRADADLPLNQSGPHAGQPPRRILRVRDKTIIGFSVIVQGLNADESMRLQEDGLGGRGKMGCGFFVPLR